MGYSKGNRIQYYPNPNNHQHTNVGVIQESKPNQMYSVLPTGESKPIGI
ncbi:1786_t:CDS:2 [Funneliformis mosseae]|uniref:1786_t:CDS:1 n=1 Tax=Funneliformis mosseae TaxID=27381 RepID=A0A9N9BU85_FUNMO|nr:1786_t:CDS:2 [Funneliformis mosseae]